MGNIQRLRAVGFWFQEKFAVQLGFGRAVKLNRAGNLLRKLRHGQGDNHRVFGRIVSNASTGFFRAVGTVNLALKVQFLLVVAVADQVLAVRGGNDDHAGHAGKK